MPRTSVGFTAVFLVNTVATRCAPGRAKVRIESSHSAERIGTWSAPSRSKVRTGAGHDPDRVGAYCGEARFSGRGAVSCTFCVGYA